MQLLDLFDGSLICQAGEPAVEADRPGGGSIALTFGEVAARSHQLARVLERRGLRAGDRLAVCLPNRLEFIDIVLACLRLGVVLVPINVLYREREVAHIVSDSQPAAAITAGEAFGLFAGEVERWEVGEIAAEAARASADPVRRALDGSHPAALVYTSGTTGRSKGAVLTHDNFLANAANLVACWRITAADRYLAVLPLFHVHGLANGLMTWLAAGCRMRLVERFDAARAGALFSSFRPTLFFGVPTVFIRLLELPAGAAQEIGQGMRLFVSGSAPLPANVFDAFRERFGHAILERYGMSETLMTISNPYAGDRRAGSVGFPLPGVSLQIVRQDGSPAGEGEAGELLVRGPTVCAGYWRQPDASGAAFAGGWFRTGDLAERAPDGYFTLRGRRTDLIISGGFNIYPREIEEVLLEMPGVREAAVIGVPDEHRGEVPVAYVALEAALVSIADLDSACRQALASFKVPRRFIEVDRLPRTALGKVQKHLLRQADGP